MTHHTNPVFKNLNEQIYHHMTALQADTELRDCLIALQTAEGIDHAEAERNAEHCLLAVSAWEGVHGQLSDNAAIVLDGLFRKLENLEESDRLLALHKIHFGLTVWENPEDARKLEEGTSAEQLFWSYYNSVCTAEDAPTAAELEGLIAYALGNYQLSPAAMRLLTRQMGRSNGHLAAAEALGESGRNLKCLMTMETWLRDRENLTMEEAANIASSSAETQAVTDALQRGYITRDVAKKLLIVLGITVAVVGIIYAIHTVPALTEAVAHLAAGPNPNGIPMSPLLKSILEKQALEKHTFAFTRQAAGALITLAGGAMAVLSDKGADLIARLSLRWSRQVRDGAPAPAEVLPPLADPVPVSEVPVTSEDPVISVPEIQAEPDDFQEDPDSILSF